MVGTARPGEHEEGNHHHEAHPLGTLDVGRIGLGAMGMSTAYTGAGQDDAESIRTIHRALDLGVTLLDTAEIYGPLHQRGTRRPGHQGPSRPGRAGHEVRHGLARRRRPRPSRQQPRQHPHRRRGLAAATRHRPHRPLLPAPGRPEHADRGHRRGAGRTGRRGQGPPHRPLRGVGRTPSAGPTPSTRSPRSSRSTRCSPATRSKRCCRCCASWASGSSPTPRSAEGSSPGRSARRTSFDDTDSRKTNPRFVGENFERNLRLVDEVEAVAAELGATPGQVALAWLLTKGDDIAPIPGTKRVARVEENVGADARRAERGADRPARPASAGCRRAPQRATDADDRTVTTAPGRPA